MGVLTDTFLKVVDKIKPKKGSSGSSVVGVDVSSSSIKIVQLKKKRGKAVLETYGELALGPYAKVEEGQATNLSTDIIATGLSDLITEAKVTSTNAGVAVPLSSSLISVIQVPKMDQKALESAIPIEARKYIPVPISEVMLDWSIVPNLSGQETESNKLDVLIVAIHKETISKYQQIVQQANLDASFFEIEIFSTIRASLDRGIAPVLLMDFGVSTTKLYVIEAGIVRDSHTINRGSQSITMALSKSLNISIKEAEDLKRRVGVIEGAEDPTAHTTTSATLNYILAETRRVMRSYEQKYNRPISKVVLTGGGSLLRGFPEYAQKELNVETVRANPFAKVETPAFLDDVLTDAGPEFAVALGTALRKLEESA